MQFGCDERRYNNNNNNNNNSPVIRRKTKEAGRLNKSVVESVTCLLPKETPDPRPQELPQSDQVMSDAGLEDCQRCDWMDERLEGPGM
jgi:hypothetical protein